MFYDQAYITITAGKGGNGSQSFRRAKFEPMGGPDGGSGGQGGNIVFKANAAINTLIQFKYDKMFKAEDGGMGLKQNMHGKNGSDTFIAVPVGTVVKMAVNEEFVPVFDFTEDGEEFIALKGGRGGIGNLMLKTSKYQAPKFAQLGEPSEEAEVELELKLVADVGLIGLPNAGKSTLIATISNARPKIADYPFTTIIPNLGVVKFREQDFVVADMPGLIEGASQGKGLGHQFLRHIERTRVLIHILDGSRLDPKVLKSDFVTIMRELKEFNPAILDKPQIVVVNKIDAIMPADLAKIQASKILQNSIAKFTPEPLQFISAAAHTNIDQLLQSINDILRAIPKKLDKITGSEHIINPLLEDPKHFEVQKDGHHFYVYGKRPEMIVLTTPMQNPEALHWMHDRLKAAGVYPELIKQGIEFGDQVTIADVTFDWE